MPFQSEKQRRYLHANHPEIAKRWEKEYAHGGILDITGDEEITTEEGNDISLVDESETGVSTLFMKKGGRVPFQGGGRDASEDDFGGGTSGGSNQGGDDKSYQGSDAGWENVQTVQEFNKTPVNENYQPGSSSQNIQDYLTDEQRVNEQKIEERNEEFLEQNPKWQQLLDKEFKKDYMNNINEVVDEISKQLDVRVATKAKNFVIDQALAAVPLGNILYSLGKYFGIFPDIKGQVPTDISGNIIGKNYVTGADLGFFDPEEYSEFWEKGPTKGDNPAAEVLPVGEEIEAYTQSDYYMSPWDRIKANQAKRAMLVEKGIIQDNPIVDESKTDVIAIGNKGGLANLFRVKKQ